MVKDYLVRPINVGDVVVYLQHYRSSSVLRKSIVVSAKGTKRVKLEDGNKDGNKLIVINGQIKANNIEYPEYFV